MKIYIISSTGFGTTELAAFDNALINAGIANTNLIPLSSIIPPNPEIVFQPPKILENEFGNRLYVVISKKTTSIINKNISSGIGWTIEKENKFGLFVEHEAETKEQVRRLIQNSLYDMIKNRSNYDFSDMNMKIKDIRCKGKPVCALTCAAYSLENWR